MKFLFIFLNSFIFCQSFLAQGRPSFLLKDYQRVRLNRSYSVIEFFKDYLDSHIYLGFGLYHLKNSYSRDPNFFLGSALGLGYPFNEYFSFGFETGCLFSQKDFNETYRINNAKPPFQFDSLLRSKRYRQNYSIEGNWMNKSYIRMDIPFRFYTKVSIFNLNNIRWLSLIVFSGLDITFLNLTKAFYYKSYASYSSSVNIYDKSFFINHFSLGARARIVFLGIEYLYQIPLGYFNEPLIRQRHCISFGLYF